MKKNLFFLIISLAALLGCSSDDETTTDNGTLTCTPQTIEAAATGGEYTVSVTASRGEWTAYTEEASWLTLTNRQTGSAHGTILLAVTPNNGTTDRQATITVASGTLRQQITLTQSALMQADVTELNFSGTGGTKYVSVIHSGSLTFTPSDSWITARVSPQVNPVSGTTPVEVTVEANPSAQSRNGQVVISAGSERITVSVYQASQPDATVAVPEGYALVWNDEFSTAGAPDANEWWYETGHGSGGWGNNEIQNYVTPTAHPNVCYVDDGFLHIIARKVDQEVLSVRMNTSRSWQYGWFEARLKLPVGKGTWPAFWMMPKNFTTWPGDGEIDIMEEVGYDPNRVYTTIHCSAYNGGAGTQKGGSLMVPTAQTDFHVYAVEWTPQYIRGLVDGREFYRYTENGRHTTWPFDAPFYLKLNLAWGGNWGGAQGTDEACLPATYLIDYVRVFQKAQGN